MGTVANNNFKPRACALALAATTCRPFGTKVSGERLVDVGKVVCAGKALLASLLLDSIFGEYLSPYADSFRSSGDCESKKL